MKTQTEKIKILEKAKITIELESIQEIQAFKNIMCFSENEVYRQSHGYDFKLEKQIVQQLRNSVA